MYKCEGTSVHSNEMQTRKHKEIKMFTMILGSQNFHSLSAEAQQQSWWLGNGGLWLTHLWFKRERERRGEYKHFIIEKASHIWKGWEKLCTGRKRTVFQEHAAFVPASISSKRHSMPQPHLHSPMARFISKMWGFLLNYLCFDQPLPSNSCGLPPPSFMKEVV